MNSLLQRQFRKHAPHLEESAEDSRNLFTAISATYDEFQQERRHLEHVLAVTSDELTAANDRIRHEAESQLASLHRRFQQTLELQQSMIICVRRTPRGFEHTLCRGELVRQLGYTPEQVEGRTIDEVAAPANVAELNAAYARAWAGEEFSCTYTNARTGRVIFAHFRPRRERGAVCEVISSSVDVTALHRTEVALRAREQLLSSINQNLSNTIVYRAEFSPDGGIRGDYVSPGTMAFAGVAPEEIQAQPTRLFELIHADDVPAFRAELARALQTGDASDIIVRLRHATERDLRWMHFRSRLTERRPDGSQVRDGVVTDVTTLKVAETKLHDLNENLETLVRTRTAALRENEEKFRGVFDHSPVIICLLTVPEGRIVEVNSAAESAFGFTRDEAMGRTSLELEVWADPAERARYMTMLKEQGAVESMEAQMRRRDGSLFTVLYSGTVVTIGGQPYSLNILQDITARKDSERARDHLLALTQATLESTADGILVVSAAGRVEIFNHAFAKMWRIPEALLADGDYVRAIRGALAQLVEPRKFIQKIRVLVAQPFDESYDTVHFKDGRVFERYSRPQIIAGQSVGRVWSFRDITARLRAEAERAQLEASLRQSQRIESLGTLAGGIAHDFNNILTGMFGFIELTRLQLPLGNPGHEWLAQTLTSCHRARDLVRQILTFSRHHQAERTPTPLGPIVAEALKLVRSTVPAMVQLNSRLDPQCPPVLADGTQIHQIIVNLCTNAWHALPPRSGQIDVVLEPCTISAEFVRTHPILRPGPGVRLEVTDNGCGMDAVTAAHIFEPFFTTKPTGQGTGLGLAVVHGIVGSHHGAITVRTAPGSGTTFEIYFTALSATAKPNGVERLAQPPRGRGESLMVVDDDAGGGLAIEQSLRALGYRPTRFLDPHQALARFKANPALPAMVVADLAMPGISGDELAREMLGLRPDLPVLLITGFIEPREQAALLRDGVREIVHKPCTHLELALAVSRHLGHASETHAAASLLMPAR